MLALTRFVEKKLKIAFIKISISMDKIIQSGVLVASKAARLVR